MALHQKRRTSSQHRSLVSVEVCEPRTMLTGDAVTELQSCYIQVTLTPESAAGDPSAETYDVYVEQFDEAWLDMGAWLWQGHYGGKMVLPPRSYFAYKDEWYTFNPDDGWFPGGTYEKLQVLSHGPAPASIQPGGDWENLRAFAHELEWDFVPPQDLEDVIPPVTPPESPPVEVPPDLVEHTWDELPPVPDTVEDVTPATTEPDAVAPPANEDPTGGIWDGPPNAVYSPEEVASWYQYDLAVTDGPWSPPGAMTSDEPSAEEIPVVASSSTETPVTPPVTTATTSAVVVAETAPVSEPPVPSSGFLLPVSSGSSNVIDWSAGQTDPGNVAGLVAPNNDNGPSGPSIPQRSASFDRAPLENPFRQKGSTVGAACRAALRNEVRPECVR